MTSPLLFLIWAFAWCGVIMMTHELGHAHVARRTGRKTQPMRYRWYGVGIPIEVGDMTTMWQVAAAGPAVNLVTAALLAPLWLLTPWFAFPCVIALSLGLVNLVPLPVLDGGWILKSLRAGLHSRPA